jgi:hypothetical protein
VSDLGSDNEESAWSGDGYQRARERLGSLILVALVTFVSFLLGMAIVLALDIVLMRTVDRAYLRGASYWGALFGYLVVASVLSRFGAAIPLLIREPVSAWHALNMSVRLTRGHSGYLIVLAVESVAGSFLASLAIRYGFELLRLPSIFGTQWYLWIYYFVVALASASVQPPMYIDFSLLGNRSTGSSEFAHNSHSVSN